MFSDCCASLWILNLSTELILVVCHQSILSVDFVHQTFLLTDFSFNNWPTLSKSHYLKLMTGSDSTTANGNRFIVSSFPLPMIIKDPRNSFIPIFYRMSLASSLLPPPCHAYEKDLNLNDIPTYNKWLLLSNASPTVSHLFWDVILLLSLVLVVHLSREVNLNVSFPLVHELKVEER